MSLEDYRRLVREASARYPRHDRFARHFAAGKLGRDPVFRHVLEQGLLAGARQIVDIGCGQGVLAALILAAQASHRAGHWPAAWPAPPEPADYLGIDIAPRDIERAREAAGALARFSVQDMRHASFGAADAIVILDVLHYVDLASQEDILGRARESLGASGRLLLRVGAKSDTLRFRYTDWVDRLVMRWRGHRLERLHCREIPQWRAILEGLGLRVRAVPMSEGTWFANVLLVADVPARGASPAR